MMGEKKRIPITLKNMGNLKKTKQSRCNVIPMASGRCYLQSHGNFFKVSPLSRPSTSPAKIRKKAKKQIWILFFKANKSREIDRKKWESSGKSNKRETKPKNIKNRAIAMMAVCTEKARCLAVWLLLLLLFFWFFYLYYVSFLLLVWACQPFRLDCRFFAFIFAFTLAAQS